MPTNLLLPVLVISAAVALIVGRADTPAGSPPAEVRLTAFGCDATQYQVPADHPPELLVRNDAHESMVFAVTDFDQLVRVAPGERVTMPLQAYVWGTFNFVCMTESAHDSAMGGRGANPYFCGLDAFALRPRALTDGKLIIEADSQLEPLRSQVAD